MCSIAYEEGKGQSNVSTPTKRRDRTGESTGDQNHDIQCGDHLSVLPTSIFPSYKTYP